MDSPVTVFRSADPSAGEDAAKVAQMLAEEGIPATVLDDNAPGVPEGAWEVRAAPEHLARAEELISRFLAENEAGNGEFENVDASSDLDTVTVFRSGGTTSEMEAMAVKALLEASGISAILIGDSRFPNLPDEVRVAREHVTEAKRLIADARTVGSEGAEEAEASGEQSP